MALALALDGYQSEMDNWLDGGFKFLLLIRPLTVQLSFQARIAADTFQ